jgi:hypothetical protein
VRRQKRRAENFESDTPAYARRVQVKPGCQAGCAERMKVIEIGCIRIISSASYNTTLSGKRLFKFSKECRMAAKTICPVTRQQFKKDAKQIEVVIDGQKLIADPREFSTGSLGWNINGKITLQVGEARVSVQVGLNLTLVGSKELPKDAPA